MESPTLISFSSTQTSNLKEFSSFFSLRTKGLSSEEWQINNLTGFMITRNATNLVILVHSENRKKNIFGFYVDLVRKVVTKYI